MNTVTASRSVRVYSRSRKQHERMTPSAHLRLRLMFAALTSGLEQPEGALYWADMAPLKKQERQGVLDEVARLRGMSAADRSVELLVLKAEGNIP